MKSVAFATAAFALAVPAFAAPAIRHAIRGVDQPAKADSYIVKLRDNVSKATHLAKVPKFGGSAVSDVTYTYDAVFHGYAGVFKGAALDELLSNPDVEYVEADGIASINFAPIVSDVEVRAPVHEVTSRATGGAGVDVYGIDTGIYTAHNSFGGRARWGATFGGYANADGNGHGTHTAATAVGNTYGQANQANVIAVKVLDDSGSGAWSDIIAGINYAVSSAKASGRPSIATMSLSGGATQSVDDAVQAGIAAGVHFTIAAGNNNLDAANYSPARAPNANTVGAVDSNNAKASFSNYGAVVDIQAPGVNILSAYIGSPSATAVMSGTSMATPYVAGILAYAISEYGNKSPAALTADLKSHARAIATGEPSGTTNLVATRW